MTCMVPDMSAIADNGDEPAASNVHENAQNLLLAIYNAEDQRASTTDLKEPTGLSAANISGRHAKTLIREGWVEKVGSQDVGAREDANVYEITSHGKKQANLLLRQKPVPMSEEQRTLMVQQLRDRVDELEEQVEQQGGGSSAVDEIVDQVENHEERIGENTEAIESNSERVDKHQERLDDFEDALGMARGYIKDLNDKIVDVREMVESK